MSSDIKALLEIERQQLRGLRAKVVTSYTEANVKNGLQFYVRRAFVGPATAGGGGAFASLNEKRYIYFTTGSKPIIVKDRVVKFIGNEFALRLYNATGQAAPTLGDELAITNYRADGGAKAKTTTAHEVLEANVGPLGTMIGDPEYYFGSNAEGQRNADSILEGRERILPPNAAFYVEVELTGGTSGRFEYFLDWYEGEPDLPRKEFS